MKVMVSVIIPTYNRVQFIRETLESVKAQSYPEWECIVVDDGSNDGTDVLVREYVANDSRFQYYKRPSSRLKGASSCRNIGLELAKGTYVQFLDSDDLIASTKFEEQVKALQYNADAVATCKWGRFSASNSQLEPKLGLPTYMSTSTPTKLLEVFGKHSTYLPSHAYLIGKSLIEKGGVWNEKLTLNDDGEFFTRILLNSSKVIYVPSTEVYYRSSTGSNLSHWSDKDKLKKLILSWKFIDEAVANKVKVKNHLFVRQAKSEIYLKVKSKYPELLREDPDFFFARLSRLEYVFNRVISRINMFYLKKLK